MRVYSSIVVMVIGALGSTCATRVPRPANVAPGTPYVTWVLMYGDRDNADAEFACQSVPRTDCVIAASRPDAQAFSDIHVYYHGAGRETRYEGTLSLGYLQGSPQSHSSPTNLTVKKNGSITNQSVTGIVTSTPGTYPVTWSGTATVLDTGKEYPIQETIEVRVKWPVEDASGSPASAQSR
jgi:hypothetical protein